MDVLVMNEDRLDCVQGRIVPCLTPRTGYVMLQAATENDIYEYIYIDEYIYIER